MDYDAIMAIKQCFCDACNVYCPNCPMHKYRISKDFAVCYYGNRPYSSTEKQISRFLAVARGHWKHEWDGRLNNSMRKILRLKARVV